MTVIVFIVPFPISATILTGKEIMPNISDQNISDEEINSDIIGDKENK